MELQSIYSELAELGVPVWAISGDEPGRLASFRDREGIEFAENKATQRVSLHSPAVLLVLAVFLLEQILGNRFYRSPGPPARS